ncbi:MAG TPA: aldolase/citrate lyase family protein [Bryobacteraceae bacterium]
MRINPVKKALGEGRLQLGTNFGHFRSVEVPRILTTAGFHWAFIDCEHGVFDIETVYDLCRASIVSGLSPVVRVASLEYDLIARALDCGAEGVIFPRVESVELLEQAVSWTKFPPMGVRGYGLSGVHLNYAKASIGEAITHLNRETMVVLQIETVKAFEMRDELLSVKGVDTVMVGPADLSISLGVPGDFQHPKMVETMEKIVESCVAHGIHPGTQTRTIGLAKFWKERGMKFLGCSSDIVMMLESATGIAGELLK